MWFTDGISRHRLSPYSLWEEVFLTMTQPAVFAYENTTNAFRVSNIKRLIFATNKLTWCSIALEHEYATLRSREYATRWEHGSEFKVHISTKWVNIPNVHAHVTNLHRRIGQRQMTPSTALVYGFCSIIMALPLPFPFTRQASHSIAIGRRPLWRHHAKVSTVVCVATCNSRRLMCNCAPAIFFKKYI